MTITLPGAYIVDGRFACATCVPADARDALAAQPVTRHDMHATLRPVTACCGGRVVRHDRDDYVVQDAA